MHRPPTLLLALALLALTLPTIGGSPPGPTGPEYIPGEVLLKFAPGASIQAAEEVRARLGATTKWTFASGAHQWQLAPGMSVERAIDMLTREGIVQYAEPNYVLHMDVMPNDARVGELWGMNNTGQTGGTADADIDADMAWGVSTGSSNVLVAVIDTGIDYNHPDLAANVWTNPGEIPGNAIDDDSNGFVDDVHGYDFINEDGDPFDDHGHGTHVSGTIGGVGNNGIGVAGVNWTVKIMGAKFLSSGGSGSTANAVRAVDYTTMMGVDLTSNSWGGGGFSQTLYDAIAAAGANNILFVAAAGNNGANSDTSPAYPAAYNLPNIISVAATDHNDQLASFSNWGLVSVDLGAPGVNTLSTLPGNSYGLLSGTSMATPHASGVCALIKAVNPNIPIAQLKQVLLDATDPIPALAGKCVSGGRLNAFFAIAEPDVAPPGMIDDLATTDPTSNTMGLTWTATGDDAGVGTASYYEVRWSTSPIDDLNWALATRAGAEPEPGPAGTPQAMEVRNLVADTYYYFAVKAFDEWGNAGPLSNIATGTTLPPPTGQVDPTSVSDDLYTGQQSDHVVTLSNVGLGTLDFSIPSPSLGEPMSPAPSLDLGKDDTDPRFGDPVTAGSGGPDTFGYRWTDSDEPGGPSFAWTDISGTGTPIAISGDDATSSPILLGFNMPFYGTLFDSIRVCTNGWLSFTSSLTSYSNQPLPTSGAPENFVAPFWDDLKTAAGTGIYFQSFGSSAIVQWTNIARYSGAGTYTFQAILESSGAVKFQYLNVQSGDLASSTVGIQNADKTVGLTVAFNQAYLHDNLAVRIASIPQWLTVAPTSGRINAGQSKILNVHMDASGLEGGTYPGVINIQTNDPSNPTLVVNASLHVIGAPDAAVQPTSLAYGTSFLGQPYTRNLIVANNGTDTLHVSAITSSHPAELVASPNTFNVPPHGSENVTVTWTPAALGPFSGSLNVLSDDAGEPSIPVSVTGDSVPSPVMIVNPTSFSETLYSGNQVVRTLTVTNTGGPDLIVDAAADLGNGQLVYADDVGVNGAGGPDGFGYEWKDSDASGGPTFDWIDISGTGTQLTLSGDDASATIANTGMTFPFYGSNYTGIRVCTNGWISFTTSSTSNQWVNTALPTATSTTTLPPNSIALFWDDLYFRTANATYPRTSRAYWKYDGTKVIIQYKNVYRLGSTEDYNFEVILYPNGKIVIQYLSMTGLLNSATVGIQNNQLQTPSNFLQMVYNADYVKNNLAIRIGDKPDWLSVSPSHHVIPPNQSANFNVTFDSTKRQGGVLNGAIVLKTNVPSQAEERVPATLTVIGAPLAATVPTSYDFGTRFTGYPYLTTFQVVNKGTDVLNVSDVYSDDPTLFVEDTNLSGGENLPEAAFPLPPGAARVFNLRWVPTTPGTLAANVHVISDDPTTPDLLMPVTGLGIPPPVAAWSPASFTESLLAGDVVLRTLHLENHGGSDLNYLVSQHEVTGVQVPIYPELKLGDDEEDPREGVLGSGGPDGYGYKWSDSDSPGGPVFDWVDISGVGTQIPFSSYTSGQNLGPFPIGFSFPFYGNTFDTFRACSNGFISFTSSSTDSTNDPLPNSGAPENLLAAFWDSMIHETAEGSAVYYYFDGTKTIVQYTNLRKSGYFTAPFFTFQILLYPNGGIVYQYQSLGAGAPLNSHTIGIQNAAKNDGLTTVFNNASYIHPGLAIRFRALDWLEVSPTSGVVPPGGAVDLDVTIDASNLIGGDYAADIDITTNDPARGLITVPVSLHVTGIPNIDAQPASLPFQWTYVGYTRTLNTVVKNLGTDVLEITGASITGDFSQTGLTPPVTLPVGASVPITVTFAPTTSGFLTGELSINSNDPDTPVLVIPLSGEGLFPPELGVSPDSLSAILPPASQTTRELQVCNTGGSLLNWTSGANIISGGSVTVHAGDEIGKDEPDTNPGVLGSGGPDVFGYRWTDSDEPGGPIFDWVDITGIGTQITDLNADDEVIKNIPLGMDFDFYGNTFNTIGISTNGWLSFSYTGTTSYLTNYQLPSTSGPPDQLALFWDDLDFRPASGPGAAYYWSDGTQFILSYITAPRYSSHELYTFQVILSQNGRIKFQYLDMEPGRLDEATIGIQNGAKNDGLTVVYNADYVHNNLAVEFKAIPQWATLSPANGAVPAGECQAVTVGIDSTDLEHGVHQATIRIRADNDPYLAFEDVPVTLTVNNKPVADAGTAQTIECTGNRAAMVTLDGTGSYDADNDPITYLWNAPGVTFDDPTSPTPTGSFPLGTTTATLVVNDGYEDSLAATVDVTVQDTIAPTISVEVTPDYLWPPNHNMNAISATVTASDICDPAPFIALASVTSSEPDDANGGGDGFTTNDIQLGTSDFAFQVRAERQGAGDGRVYTATYTATDQSGNQTPASDTIDVPHSLDDVVEPIVLKMAGAQSTTVSWDPVVGAVHYDVVRGNLSELRIDGSNVDMGRVTCIEQDSLNSDTIGSADSAVPAAGQVFFYTVQFNDGMKDSSYGSEDVGRARVIQNNNGDCP